ncbi:MAG: ABC transporter permease [Pseudomonadales bacterium]|jgi:ABC-2 type transport system permease protein|nr:ABC transporter permease [Gammaproteobacteria bacterium]MBL6744425.1 ABC transporter permease [Pseudomonadales bacterium]MCH1600258.1 ABC transporter permease [Pseudomonadales bacterium]HAU24491.1 ABC transporter permease [Gammaproteobacteria bacterium]HBJ88790.1 ABC transporter permease [Gammaproteobacteria bacterium]|tara:strand:- start:132 stop:905 length:774 start_codon:yes stop_codon:yes gene_type:complete
MYSNHKLIAFETIVVKEVRRFSRIWVQTLVPPAITIALYFVIFGNLVGRRVGEMGGFQYMEFIVPGLIMMAVIQNSYSNVVSSFFSQKFQRSVEELLVSPVPNYVILSGFIVGGMARGLAVGAIVTSLALFFADIQVAHPLITISVVLLTSIVFSLAGFINAVFANSFDDISIIPTFVLTPLIYLGGVFYSAQLLPPFWQTVSALNPIFYMVNTFRYGFLGSSDVDVIWAFMILGIFAVSLYAGCIWLLRHGTGIRN